MNEKSEATQEHNDSRTDTPAGFKGFKEAEKALKALQPPIAEDSRSEFLERVRTSPSARYIAFRLLAQRALGEMQAKLAPFTSDLESILHAGDEPLNLRDLDSVESLRNAVLDCFSDLRDKADWKRFLSARSHLPIIYGVIRIWNDPTRFQAGLDALAKATARTKKGAAKSGTPNNLEPLVRGVLTRVPEKPVLGNGLPELLKIVEALFGRAESTSKENLQLSSQLEDLTRESESLQSQLRDETAARMSAESEKEDLVRQLTALQSALKEEREHFETLKAHSNQERKRAVEDATARVRREVSHRIENIRLFADREQPNRQGILSLVSEIQDAFQSAGGVA